jgi:hypothetical protein
VKNLITKALQERWTVLHSNQDRESLIGRTPETWLCVDCGANTAPGCQNRKEAELALAIHGQGTSTIDDQSEVYTVKEDVWALTKLAGWGGCLCIGCLEQRIGRRLKPNDFVADHPFNSMPGTKRLLKRRGKRAKRLPWEGAQ